MNWHYCQRQCGRQYTLTVAQSVHIDDKTGSAPGHRVVLGWGTARIWRPTNLWPDYTHITNGASALEYTFYQPISRDNTTDILKNVQDQTFFMLLSLILPTGSSRPLDPSYFPLYLHHLFQDRLPTAPGTWRQKAPPKWRHNPVTLHDMTPHTRNSAIFSHYCESLKCRIQECDWKLHKATSL
jgi:hypothetical protein